MAIPGNMLSPTTERVDPNTSGWTAMLNATVSLGSGGRTGDGCLLVKSVGSGEMRARTVSSYPVRAATVYQVFADASGSVVPERIGIRWLNKAGAETSITWSLTTASASSAWHRIGVAGPAPIGAIRAQVVVSATTGAPNISSFFENVYLGLPIRTTGNLLGFKTESSEVSVAGWTPVANATISRQAPVVQWPVDWYTSGGHVVAMTAVAAGNASILATERPAVSPGVEYVAYTYLQPPVVAATSWIELRCYDANGNQIVSQRSILTPPGTGFYRQKATLTAPAAAASCSVAVGLTGAAAGQVLRVETVVVTVAPPVQAGSVIPYADASFEQGPGAWTRPSGVATLARSAPWGAYAVDGTYSLTATSTTATASTIRSPRYPLPAGSGGLNWRLMLSQDVTAGGWTMSRGVRWYDAANTDLGVTVSSTDAASTPGWWYLVRDMIAPAGATQAAVELVLTATGANSVLRLDKIALWQTLPLISTSVRESSASVTLTLREMIVGSLLKITRVTSAGARALVRGPAGLYDGTTAVTSDLLVVEDYEAPLGVPVHYLVELADPDDDTVESRTSGAVTIPYTSTQLAWLKDPGNPQRNLRVMVATAPDWQRPIEQAEYRVRGRRNSVILSDVRGGLEGDLSLYTQSDDERAALHWLLDSGAVILWQAIGGMGVTDMYVNVGQATEARGGGIAQDQLRVWTLPLKEADRPTALGVSGSAGRTWQDVLAENTTWQQVLDRYATWEDVLFDRPIGG